MSRLLSVLLSACISASTISSLGCRTISMASADGPVVGSLQGPVSSDPAPISPLPSVPGSANTWQTSVAVQSGEDLSGPCNYFLYVAHSSATLRGVFVIYDRSDSRELFTDSGVRSLVASLNFGLLLAQQCDAASFKDIQQNAFNGPGRTLFTALNQFASSTSHAELQEANVLLFGFSAAGVLAVTTANYKPERVIGVIPYDGASAPQQLNTVVPFQGSLEIPFLLLSNDHDLAAGTSRDELFFQQGWKKGAPWAWAVQHGVAHCCALSTKSIILPWISAVVFQRVGAGRQLNQVAEANGVFDNYTCSSNGYEDVTGYENCTFTSASLIPANDSITGAGGWLPDSTTADAWLKWVGK